jgi:hypothetical protein
VFVEMADLRQCSKELLIELFEVYISNPCLWKVKGMEYMDRDKNNVYETLVNKWQQVDPTTNRNLVAKKLTVFPLFLHDMGGI